MIKIIKYITDSENITYVVILIVGIILATYKYGLIAAILAFGIVIVLGLFLGLIISWFYK